MTSAVVIILRLCWRQKSVSSGTRAMVPSSLMISQMTPEGSSPAMRARSTRGFGLSGANQDAAFAGAQRKDVAGTHQVGGARGGIDGDLDGAGAVGGADAGGDALAGFDGFGEGGAEGRLVGAGHGARRR